MKERKSPGAGATCGSILLAEDDDSTRGVLAAALRKSGYHVIEAGSGDDAMNALGGRAPISLVIADNGMPGAAWKEIAAFAQQRTRPAKLLLISGHCEEVLRDRGEFLAGFPFMSKPFSMREFLTAVEALCDPGFTEASAHPEVK
jgi:DNA-binding response OmpR family regulator